MKLRVMGARKTYLAEATACPAFNAGLATLVNIEMVLENERLDGKIAEAQ